MSALKGLKKKERLKGQQFFDDLFKQGQSDFLFPFKLVYIQIDQVDEENPQFLFGVSVPKRKFRKAVDRNRLKRLIREAYRLNKPQYISVIPKSQSRFALLYIYVGDLNPSLEFLSQRMRKLNGKWISKIENAKPCNL